jgi:hypothetical protein
MMIDTAVALASEIAEQDNFMNTPFPKFDKEQEIVRVKFHIIEE